MEGFTSESHLISSPPTAHVTPTSELPIHNDRKRTLPFITVSYKVLTYITSISLIVIPILYLKMGCDSGQFPCTFTNFPYVSYVMGIFPNEKTYMFLM